ncbi:enoyl-[acyl-carrier protein] reductase / trans-2-enoyl-CoA reductase (NAD+) [Marininema mesophilum]|uniref:Trans-2-enoyl-CoA reductase [NADH] n=1 Tax=Marininema mesophilum TaxID=1048340 RepID=A0A1H2TG32_9BACL|nr:enoyl-ACP reductase FabV [Marininema mesophilum]SDW42224.1 enoyl-[acyl-carrier protein] reductase / trans-2-enoyl-CoA reductase (NAD+) [Marininema mesophilum]
MIIQPKFRGFVCTTAHPEGCATHVREQIEYVKGQPSIQGPKNVLVIGASTGYGLASRISAAFSAKAATIGVFFEKPASGKRTATAGWYNSAAFEQEAHREGLYAKSINGDAFSNELKQQTIDLIKKDLGQVDLVIYSLASPKRKHPVTGELFSSVLKPIGRPYASKTVDFHTGVVSEVSIEPANDEEIRQTVAVMGGEDWEMWVQALSEAGVLADGATTLAYSYLGPTLTWPIYRDGSIGRAKIDLDETAHRLDRRLKERGGRAYVSVNKAVVTQSSSAIPVVPLYISILFKLMKEQGTHEGCTEQIYRLLSERLYGGEATVDENGRLRIDDLEMKPEIQEEVTRLWEKIGTDNIKELSDLTSYREEFFRLFGFEFDGVDYKADIDPDVKIPSINE